MYSTFFGIELGKRALMTSQLALHTTSHNIANVNTPGYSRQRSELVATTPFVLPEANRNQIPGQLGTGVEVDFISRARDLLLDRQIRDETSTLGSAKAQADYFSRIEEILHEPSDQSVNQALSDFWAAWQELSVYPEDTAVRNTLIATSERLTTVLRTKDAELLDLQQTSDQAIRAKVAKVNELGAQIRDLNVRINQTLGVEAQPNDLYDQRDQLLSELSELTAVESHQMPNGLTSVTIGGHTMVQDNVFVPLTVTDDPLNNNYAQVTWSDDTSVAAISDGAIAGLVQIRDSFVPVYRQALNDLALGLMAAVNPAHAAGYALNAAAPSGLSYFSGTGVQDLAVNPILISDPTRIAAASAASAPGDGSNALAIARLQNGLTMAAGTQNFGTFVQNLVAQIGLDSQHNTLVESSQATLVDSLSQQQEAVAGVSLDEEMTDLIRYQDGYQAAVRVISTMDEMLDTVINKMGAGR